MRALELFSGAGGLAKGLENTGFKHLAFVEVNKDACSTLKINFSKEAVFNIDVRDFCFSALKDVDLVAGGPPCQPFSLGGKHRASADCRDMFPYAIKAIHELKPKAFIFENVKGLLRESFAEYFNYIILKLRYPKSAVEYTTDWRLSYSNLKNETEKNTNHVSYKLLNAADYGIPQLRERVFIVGLRSDQVSSWKFPIPTHNQERLLWDQYVTGDYWERHGIAKPNLSQMSESLQRKIEKLSSAFMLFPPPGKAWQTVRDALKGSPEPNMPHELKDHLFKDGAKCYPGHTGSVLDWPAKTIKAGSHGVPGGENMIRFADETVRYLTVYEAKLLQTFPPDYTITGAWGEAMRQIGNAVPVKLAECLGESIYATLVKPDPLKFPKRNQLLVSTG